MKAREEPHAASQSKAHMLYRSSLISAAALAVCGTAYAQQLSFISHDITIGPNCCTVAAGDFNNDGNVDLVVGYGTGTLALMLGDGSGGFRAMNQLATFNQTIARILAADVNHDGKLDVMVGSGNHGSGGLVYVLLGKGDGTFAPPMQVGLDPGTPLFVADLNGDGNPYIGVLYGFGGCDLEVLAGNVDGTFQSPPKCLNGGENMSLNAAIGDLNGDGIPDLVWSSGRSNGNIHVFLGIGSGAFAMASGMEVRCNGFNKSLAIADLNQDGKMDVVAGGAGCITVYFGKGDGTFQEPRAGPLTIEIPLDFSGYHVSNDLFIADFNGDGNLDIAFDNVVVFGHGDGTFEPPQYFLTASPAAGTQAVADVNHDGLPDLVSIESSATALAIMINNIRRPSVSVVGHSAATGTGPIAPSSIGSVYGKGLATVTSSAAGMPLPTELGGIRLGVRDGNGTAMLAPLLYVSPTQINFLVPDQTAVGLAVLTVDEGGTSSVESADATVVVQIAPGIFTANGNGEGVAAATAVRIFSDGSQQSVPVFNCTASGQCRSVPIDLSGDHHVYLTLYGTGFRYAQRLAVTCTVAGVYTPVQYAGPQPTIPGLDQINLLLPSSLPSGDAVVRCQFGLVDGNPVQITIQ